MGAILITSRYVQKYGLIYHERLVGLHGFLPPFEMADCIVKAIYVAPVIAVTPGKSVPKTPVQTWKAGTSRFW